MFFLFIFGSRWKVMSLVGMGTANCPPCERPRQFRMLLQYRYFHIYWLLRAVTARKYFRVCTVCSQGQELKRRHAESGLGYDPIPASDRLGLGVAVGAALLLLLVGAILV